MTRCQPALPGAQQEGSRPHRRLEEGALPGPLRQVEEPDVGRRILGERIRDALVSEAPHEVLRGPPRLADHGDRVRRLTGARAPRLARERGAVEGVDVGYHQTLPSTDCRSFA